MVKKKAPILKPNSKKISSLLHKSIKSLSKESINSPKSKNSDPICCLQSQDCAADVVTDIMQCVCRWHQREFAIKSVASREFQILPWKPPQYITTRNNYSCNAIFSTGTTLSFSALILLTECTDASTVANYSISVCSRRIVLHILNHSLRFSAKVIKHWSQVTPSNFAL